MVVGRHGEGRGFAHVKLTVELSYHTKKQAVLPRWFTSARTECSTFDQKREEGDSRRPMRSQYAATP